MSRSRGYMSLAEGRLLVVIGLAWVVLGARAGWLSLLLTVLPGALLLAAGISRLLWPGDRRPLHFAAGATLIGVGMALPVCWLLGALPGLALVSATLGIGLRLGFRSLASVRPLPEVPRAPLTSWVASRAVVDEGLLAWLHARFAFPEDSVDMARIGADVERALQLSRARGWLQDPASYHRAPDAPASFDLRPRSLAHIRYQHLRFESGFVPHGDEPGAEAWQAHAANRTAHAWVLEHADPTRPWVIGVHGYRLGFPIQDFVLFPPSFFHERLKLNVALCVLPLHGPRRSGTWSGDGFLDGDPLRMRHAEAQSIWDLRRLIGWIRERGGRCIGVSGISLGAYSAALLATLEDELAFVIAGTPPVDLARMFDEHGPPDLVRRLADFGISEVRVRELLHPVSPLALPPRVPHAARFIYAGTADRVVTPDHAQDLFVHWERPRMLWYPGGHFAWSPQLQPGILTTLREAKALG